MAVEWVVSVAVAVAKLLLRVSTHSDLADVIDDTDSGWSELRRNTARSGAIADVIANQLSRQLSIKFDELPEQAIQSASANVAALLTRLSANGNLTEVAITQPDSLQQYILDHGGQQVRRTLSLDDVYAFDTILAATCDQVISLAPSSAHYNSRALARIIDQVDWDFFVSFARSDQAWAEWIAWQIEKHQYRVTLQAWDFAPGANFVRQMSKAVERADRTLALISPAYLSSVFDTSEWRAAWARDPLGEQQKLVPIRIVQCDLPAQLTGLLRIDLFNLSESAAKHRMQSALKLGRRRGRAPGPDFPHLTTRTPTFPRAMPEVWNVPSRNPDFTGREKVLDQIGDGFATTASRIQMLSGIAGVGKSETAVEYVYRHSGDYDAVWWINAGNAALINGQIAELGKHLTGGASDRTGFDVVLDELRNVGRWLLIFDDLSDLDPLAELIQLDVGHILITTRRNDIENPSSVLELDVLTASESVRLLQRLQPTVSRSETQSDDMRLADALGHHPLALTQAAAYMAHNGILSTDYLVLFAGMKPALADGRASARAIADVTISLSVRALRSAQPAAYLLLELCSWVKNDPIRLDLFTDNPGRLPAPLGDAAADALLFADAVGALVDSGLAIRVEDGLSLHPLVQGVVRRNQAQPDRILAILAGLLGASQERLGQGGGDATPPTRSQPDGHPDPPKFKLADVFKRNGTPSITFVEPPAFYRFRAALDTPGRGIVIEGPSGIGKTTFLERAVKLSEARLQILAARRAADLPVIANLPEGHKGIVAVDDFHRLSRDLKQALVDYLKVLADEESENRLILSGIPGTGQELVRLGFDVVTRIDIFRLPKVSDALVLRMLHQGELALNVTFPEPSKIVAAAAGSLHVAQMVCWELAVLAGVQETLSVPTPLTGSATLGIEQAWKSCAAKFEPGLAQFVALDGPHDVTCAQILKELAQSEMGLVDLSHLSKSRPRLRPGIDRLLSAGPEALDGAAIFGQHLHLDLGAATLLAEDPQLLFYLRQRSVEQLAALAGKRVPMERDQVFVSYSHADATWLTRLEVHLRPLIRDRRVDLWADTRIKAGDHWKDEIANAIARAKVAVLLVSANFLASEFIDSDELPPLLRAAKENGCRIIPVMVSPSLFTRTPSLSVFQSLNNPSQPLSALSHHEQEEILTKLAETLMDLI